MKFFKRSPVSMHRTPTATTTQCMLHARDLAPLVRAVPTKYASAIQHCLSRPDAQSPVDIIFDINRFPVIRHATYNEYLYDTDEVTAEDLQHTVLSASGFDERQRTGIPGTLHRVSALRDRYGQLAGLTYRVGRSDVDTLDLLPSRLFHVQGSVLLIGPPGAGKTTALRALSKWHDLHGHAVVIVDKSCEIAGAGDSPHPCVGMSTRRLAVPHGCSYADVLIEAVENHTPTLIIADEISTFAEARACRSIAERGVRMIATCHGTALDSVVRNPALSQLVGGCESVTISDMEAARRGTRKTVLERSHQPVFEFAYTLLDKQLIGTAESVDALLE